MRKAPANPSRRDFLHASAAAVAGCMTARESPAGAMQPPALRGQPNILLLVGEGLRADELSFTGNPIIHTPNLDRIGYEGINFKNTFVTNALCSPSRANILTGLHSHATGCLDNRNRVIPSSIPIFSDLLHQAGYDVSCFGKAHMGNALTDHYWDYYFAFNGASTNYYHPRIAEGRGGHVGEPQTYHGYVDDLLTEKAVEWISEERTKPFFCLFMFQAPHAPFYRSRRNLDLYNGVAIPKPVTFDDDLKGYPGKPRAFAEADNKIGTTMLGDDDPRTLEETVKDHYAGVVNNDQNFQSLLGAIDKAGKLDDTVIILTSDHGFFLGEWRLYDKRLMHEPSIRVPLLIRYPKLIQAGSSVEKMALSLDLAPTILDLAGVPIPQPMHGKSLVPFLSGTEPPFWRKDWLYEYYEYPGNQQIKPHRGVRTERYKLIHYYSAPEEFELYDLQNDPGEIYNLYGDPRHAELFKQLIDRLQALREETRDPEILHTSG